MRIRTMLNRKMKLIWKEEGSWLVSAPPVLFYFHSRGNGLCQGNWEHLLSLNQAWAAKKASSSWYGTRGPASHYDLHCLPCTGAGHLHLTCLKHVSNKI